MHRHNAGPGRPSDGRFWTVMTGAAPDTGELLLYGDICRTQPIDWWTGEKEPGLFITPEGFLEDLEPIRNKSNIIVRLNSGGGNLDTGVAIHNALKGLKGRKTVVVEGLAASAASLILCAGDEVQVYPGSMVMVHRVGVTIRDHVQIPDLERLHQMIDAGERQIAEIYNRKTGRATEELRALMNAETWLVGQEAVDAGFADTLLEGEALDIAISADRKVLLVAGISHDIGGYHNVPERLLASRSFDISANGKLEQTNPQPKRPAAKSKGVKGSMTLEELRAAQPELVAQIERDALKEQDEKVASAVKAERERLQAIEAIAKGVGDPALVKEAMYGEKPMDAQALAFEAMKRQAALGQQHLSGLEADAADSGTDKVAATPNGGGSGDEKQGAELQATISSFVKNVEQMTGGKRHEQEAR